MENIDEIYFEILSKYGCPQYLKIAGKNTCEDVMDTRLCSLWYGEEFNDLCVRTLNYYICLFKTLSKQGSYVVKDLENGIIKLRDDLKIEFENLDKERMI